jgi:hypothetical protein
MKIAQMVKLVLVVGGALAAGVGPARADVLYQTGFEPPAFVVGPLAGQGGWQDIYASSAGSVTTSLPASGTQAALIDGGSLRSLGGGLIGTYQQDIGLNATAAGLTIRVQADIRFDGPSTATGNPIDDDVISANLTVVNGDGDFLASWVVSAGGNAFAFGSFDELYLFGLPVALGEYNTFGFDLDFAASRTNFLFNGAVVFSSPFDPNYDRTTLGGVQLEIFSILGAQETAQYQARFDNVLVAAVPELGSLAVLGLAVALGGAGLVLKRVPRAA